MERRVLLALLLCFAVLYVWQAVFIKPVPKPAAGLAPSTQQTATTPSPPTAGSPTTAGEAARAPSTAAVVTGESSERDLRVDTRDVIAVFTNRGGRLKSWRLKHY